MLYCCSPGIYRLAGVFILSEYSKKKARTIKDITEIEVNLGPGSFTGLRVGGSVANALGWLLGIPVNGKDLCKGEFVDILYTKKIK